MGRQTCEGGMGGRTADAVAVQSPHKQPPDRAAFYLSQPKFNISYKGIDFYKHMKYNVIVRKTFHNERHGAKEKNEKCKSL